MYNLNGDYMSVHEELEIEFKSLLTNEEFESLITKFNLQDKFIEQYNYYFDTEDKFIMNSDSSFRIRLRNNKFKITYKSRNSANSVIEKSIDLSYDQAMHYLESGYNSDLLNLDLPELHHRNTLMTKRASFKIDGGEIFIDKNYYSNIVDYEIEFECLDEITGRHTFESFLNENSIIYKESKPKMVRAFSS